MSKLLYTSFAQPLRLGSALGAGGAGTVYEVKDTPNLVAKLYHEPPTPERAEKLALLARLGNERLFKLTAWPIDVLRLQPDGPITGFTMQCVGQAEEVHALHSPKSRLQKFPDASWAFLLYVAANIARAVAVVHEHGFVVGDLNPKNILVTRQATVYLLDCDSFQIEAEGRVWRCEQGFPEYTPPELQGVAFRDVDRNATHDAFGLAVVIFQLLFLGRHPFSGKFTGTGELPLERAIRELRFAYGSNATSRQMQQPPGTLALEAVSKPVAALFRRAFLTAERPQPREWIEALESLAQTLQRCAAHSGHQFYQELDTCPWCEIEKRARTRLFNFALNGKVQTQNHFRLDKIWQDIEGVLPPLVPQLPVRQALALVPSHEAYAAQGKQRTSYFLALFFALMSGWGLAAFFKAPLSFIFLFIAAKIAQRIADAEPSAQSVTQTIFQQHTINAPNPLIHQFVEARAYAEAEHRQLSERWHQEATAERFHQKLHELRTWKSAYENMDAARTLQLTQPHMPPRRRWKLEQEFEAARLQLERDLNTGAEQLRQMRDEIKENQRRLHEPLLNAQSTLAQAERDHELVAERNPRVPLVVLLILSFLFGSLWTTARQPRSVLSSDEHTAQPNRSSMDEAMHLYNQGTLRLNRQDFKTALFFYQRAVELDPKLAGAYQEMGQAYYQLGDYHNAIAASLNALRIAQTSQAHNTLGLSYMAQRDWRSAKNAFQNAMQRWYGLQNPNGWQLRYNWALCVVALGETEPEIRRLRQDLDTIVPSPFTNNIVDVNDLIEQQERQFDLAVLCQLTGRRREAQRLLKILEVDNDEAASELRRLLASPPALIPD
jgi:tetratricopeptide (TPR) repeat protein/serine/threonine protein kinase